MFPFGNIGVWSIVFEGIFRHSQNLSVIPFSFTNIFLWNTCFEASPPLQHMFGSFIQEWTSVINQLDLDTPILLNKYALHTSLQKLVSESRFRGWNSSCFLPYSIFKNYTCFTSLRNVSRD